MESYIMNSIKPGMEIDAKKIGLPTSGAKIVSVETVREGETAVIPGLPVGPTGDFVRVMGEIYPADAAAPNILFTLGIPYEWNGKFLQIGGGGLDGMVTPVEMPIPGRIFGSPAPTAQNYAVASCDGGHQTDQENPNDCSWGLNNECRANYAHCAQKKTYDAVVEILKIAFGKAPEKTYYAGGSNGGRETLKVLEQYPQDYDGAICLYPAQVFIGKVLKDVRYGNLLEQLGDEAVILPDQWMELQKKIVAMHDAADGTEDGLVSDLWDARARRSQVREMLERELNEKQMCFLDELASDLKLPFDLGHGHSIVDGYAVYEGAPVIDMFHGFPFVNIYGNCSGARDTVSIGGAEGIIKAMIMRDMDFDVRHMDYEAMKKELMEASELFDVSVTSLDRFQEMGGKLILVQGGADPLITPYMTIRYYEELKERFGEQELRKMLRFYLIPGYGHGVGGNYYADVDWLSALDAWVCEGREPRGLVSLDGNDSVGHRMRPVYEYPYYPVYNGSGDPNDADSYHFKKKESK